MLYVTDSIRGGKIPQIRYLCWTAFVTSSFVVFVLLSSRMFDVSSMCCYAMLLDKTAFHLYVV